jgi:hypothetical protein
MSTDAERLERIRELHSPVEDHWSNSPAVKPPCAACSDPFNPNDSVEWPCETRKIADDLT